MPLPLIPTDVLQAAASAALDGRASGRELVDAVRQRVEDRARDALAPYTPLPFPKLGPDWPVELTMPDGRRVRVTMSPGLARRSDLDSLRETVTANMQRTSAALQQQGVELARLRRQNEALAKQVAVLQSQASQSLTRLADGVRGFDRKVSALRQRNRVLLVLARATKVRAIRQRAETRAMAATARMQQVTAVVNSAQNAAYGQRGSVFATNNLLLAANQLFWTFLDPALRELGAVKGSAPSLAVWLAPLGSLVTGQVALGSRQHDRFVSGVITLRGGQVVVAHSLRGDIAPAYFNEFRDRTDVPVSIEGLDGLDASALGLVAVVRSGTLFITSREDFESVRGRVAWMIDLGPGVG